LENLDLHKPGGPVFLIFGGPLYGPVSADVLTKGATAMKAKIQGAAVVLLEIRFFGKSRPTPSVQFNFSLIDTQNRQYNLNSIISETYLVKTCTSTEQ